jgi:hypothetical protein
MNSQDYEIEACVFPIHFFKRFMDYECFNIFHEETPPDIPYMFESLTKTQWKQFQNEYEYSFGKTEMGNNDKEIVFGYTDGFCRYLFQCIRFYMKHPTEKLRQEILKAYGLIFESIPRVWDDVQLDNLHNIIEKLKQL